MGDECPTPKLHKDDLQRIFGAEAGIQSDFSLDNLLTAAGRQWEIYHIIVNDASYKNDKNRDDQWRKILGQRVIILDDHSKLAETVVSAIQLAEGTTHADVL